MDPIESEGATVAEAVDAALKKHGLRREQVEVAVLNEGASGFIGLGAQLARVRLTEKRWGETSTPRPESASTSSASADACARAQTLIEDLLRKMTIAAPTVMVSWDEEMERVKAVVESQDATFLVAHDGKVLESLQFLATLMLSRGAETPIAVQIDALSYWEKREAAILDVARNGAESVKATGRPYRLEPMDAAMRRLIHRTLASNPDVVTASEGEGPWRKIVIRPRQG